MPERSAGNLARMEGRESSTGTVRQVPSSRLAVALGALALTLNLAALVLAALAGRTAPELVRLTALLPTVAVGMLVAVRRPETRSAG
jgi:Mg/Co/Ni transporter MgtE